ncbi:MFS transporter [Bacillus sp. BGMRC 2118]|nr:MFS transporter [Bacillus sp. BGMRC 2118]
MENQLWTKNFISICVTNFLLFLNFYYLLVILPIYSVKELHGPESQAGLIVTVFLIAAIITRPISGQLIQRYGAGPIFILSIFIFLAATVLYYYPDTMFSLLLIRLFHGVGFGMATTAAGTIVADVIPDSRKGEGMGYYGLTMNLAMAIGPFLGITALNLWGIDVMFTISTVFVLIATVTGLFIKLPKREVTKNSSNNKGLKVSDIFEASAIRISLVGGFFALVYSAVLSFVAVYAVEAGFGDIASYFFVVYAIILILSRPFTGKWFDLYGANVIIYPSILSFAIGLILLSQAETSLLFLVSAAFIGLGWGTAFPSFQTIAIQHAAPVRRGMATATFLSIFDIGVGLGSFIVGVVGARIGFSSLYFISSFFTLFGIGLYFILHGKKSRIHSHQ